MFNLGNRLWHSDSSYKVVPAKYSLLSGRIVTEEGGETQFADMRAAYDALDQKTKELIEDMVCEHSLIYSRGTLGFDELSEEELKNFNPVLQSLVRTNPDSGGNRFISRLISAASSARPVRKASPLSAIWRRTPPGPSSSIPINGSNTIWSSGTTARPCIAPAPSTTSTKSATCGALPSPARARRSSRRSPRSKIALC